MVEYSEQAITLRLQEFSDEVSTTIKLLTQYDPAVVLARGYALVRGEVDVGSYITIERSKDIIQAEVRHVSKK